MAIEVLPTTLMTLPAAQGGLTASFQIYAQHLQDWGFPVPSIGADVAALALTACLAAVASLGEIAPSIEEFVSFTFMHSLTLSHSLIYSINQFFIPQLQRACLLGSTGPARYTLEQSAVSKQIGVTFASLSNDHMFHSLGMLQPTLTYL